MPNEATAISPVAPVTPVTASANLPDGRLRGEAEQRANDYRLVIEQGPRMGSYIYKTVDRNTGETIKQFPREEVVKLFDSPDYSTGTVADTKA